MTESRRMLGAYAVAGLAVLAMAAACGSDDGPALVTTSSRVVTTAAPTTTAPTTTAPITTAAAPTTTPAPTTIAEEQDTNQIYYRVARQESTRDGSVLYVEIPPGDYTDIDLENLVLSVYEERGDLYELHVVDDREAVAALLKAEGERTPEEADSLERHYLVSFLEGSILRFQGPFAELEGFIVGS